MRVESGAAAGSLDAGDASHERDPGHDVAGDERPYLCTDFDCYLLREPCSMCGMALLHSRVRRVFFCQPDERHGVLGGSGVRLHGLKGINHRYSVFRVIGR